MGKKVNQTELAEIVGVSDVSLWQWQKEEMPVDTRNTRGQSNVYDTADVIQWMVDRAVKKVRTESPRDALAMAQTELVKIQIAEKQGALVSAEEAEHEYERMVVRSRQRIMQISATLPVDDVTRRLIDQELRSALKELSQYDSSASNDGASVGEVGSADETAVAVLGGDEPLHERQVAVPGTVPVVDNAVSPGGAGSPG
jgi:phage terminase Nu1 subunit (DNA packaging protein)